MPYRLWRCKNAPLVVIENLDEPFHAQNVIPHFYQEWEEVT